MGIHILLELVIFSLGFMIVSTWHAYNVSRVNRMKYDNFTQSNPSCSSYIEATKPLDLKTINRMKLWSTMFNEFDLNFGETIYGLQDALEIIFKNQFPTDCRNQKYLITGGWPAGFGSRIHIEGWGIAMAIQLGRIYLPQPDGDYIFWETLVPFCKEQNKRTLDCFFEAFSSCTIEDALYGIQGDVNSFRTMKITTLGYIFESEENRLAAIKSLENDRGINIDFLSPSNIYCDVKTFIPFEFSNILNCAPMRDDNRYYWWRAITTVFLLRPNNETLQFLSQYRYNLTDEEVCISTYVRHGDKAVEMKLVPFDSYANAISLLWNKYMKSFHSDYIYQHQRQKNTAHESLFLKNTTLFLGTEDPNVIEDAIKWATQNKWKLIYTELFSRATQSARLDFDTAHHQPQVHDDLEYLSMILNLEYSVRCEGFVCTIASNFCRIIDEMRATIGMKANRFYADLSYETCSNPPCIGSENITKFQDR